MYCTKCGNHVNDDQKFCNKCGFHLENNDKNINVNNNENNNNQNNQLNQNVNKKKSIIIGLGAGFAVLIIIILIIFVTSRGKNYYFSNNTYNNDDVEQNDVIKQNKDVKRKSKYSTVIIADNTYDGVTIKDEKDANALISKDSNSQKNNCPPEIKKVEEDIINQSGITAVNLCELNLDFAKEIANVFKKTYKEYPNAKKLLTNLTLINAPMSDGYIAAFMPTFAFATSNKEDGYPWVIKTQIVLNTQYFLNPERLDSAVLEGSSSGHFPPNATIYSPVAHEFGHYLSFLALMNNYQMNSILLLKDNNMDKFYKITDDFRSGDFSLKMIEEAYEDYKKDNATSLSIDEWRGTISKYALAKDNAGNYIYDETIAEAFHDVYLNGDNAKDASKYVTKVLKRKLG